MHVHAPVFCKTDFLCLQTVKHSLTRLTADHSLGLYIVSCFVIQVTGGPISERLVSPSSSSDVSDAASDWSGTKPGHAEPGQVEQGEKTNHFY